MKNIRPIYCCFFILLIIASCRQINKSLQETKHPQPTRGINDDNNFTAAATTTSNSVINTISSVAQGRNVDAIIADTALLSLIQQQLNSMSQTKDISREQLIAIIRSSLPQNNMAAKNIIVDSVLLDQIQMQLQNLPQFKGKKLNLYNIIYIHKSTAQWIISINIQNPDTLENIDTYLYRNSAWQLGAPVKVHGNQDNVSFLCPLEKVRFSAAKKVYETAMEKSKEIQGGGPVSSIYFSYLYLKSLKREDAEWYTNIDGTRQNYRINFDIKGNFTKMKEW